MSRRMATADVAAAGGVFQRLGDLVVRRPLLVIGFWIALAAVLSLTLPPLAQIAAQRQPAGLPNDAPVMVASREITEAFHEAKSDNMLLVALTNEKYRALVEKLHQDTHDVTAVQDFISTPPLREVLQSKDNKAWLLPITVAGDLGSPQAQPAYKHVTDLVKQSVA